MNQFFSEILPVKRFNIVMYDFEDNRRGTKAFI